MTTKVHRTDWFVLNRTKPMPNQHGSAYIKQFFQIIPQKKNPGPNRPNHAELVDMVGSGTVRTESIPFAVLQYIRVRELLLSN